MVTSLQTSLLKIAALAVYKSVSKNNYTRKYSKKCIFVCSHICNMASSTNSPLTKPESIALSTAFGLVALTIIAGNSVTIAAFTKTRLLRKPTHYFLISLAVADLMVGSLAMPLYICHFVDSNLWSGSQVIQTLYYTIDVASGMASVLTLAVVSVERLYAVGWPWKYRHSTPLKCYIIAVAVTWFLAIVISCLYLGYRFKFISSVVHIVTVIALSISLSVACSAYSALWFRIKRRRRHRRGVERDKKLSITLFVITGIFILTWTPFEAIIIIVHFCKDCTYPSNRVVYVIKLLQYSNSFVNTIVYSFRMQEFRKAILSFLRSGSLSPKRNIQVRNVTGVTLTSISTLVNSCSAMNLSVICTGNQLPETTTGHRRLARRRADLFAMHRRAKYSPGRARVAENV